MSKKVSAILLIAAGIALAATGLTLLKIFSALTDQAYPYVLIGIGSGALGGGIANFINYKIAVKYPSIARQSEIEQKDERNQAIVYRSKAKAYDCMVFLFGALMLVFTLMNCDLPTLLLFVFSYLFTIGYGIFYRIKYQSEM
jgi:hypothetical protein